MESWPGGMPHQEIYLALLDQQASAAMAQIEKLLKDCGEVDERHAARGRRLAKTIERSTTTRRRTATRFSRNAGRLAGPDQHGVSGAGLVEPTRRTGNSILAQPEVAFSSLPAHALNTDWGLRDVANDEKIYDGMSYHQGSVWPLFTGWAALAEYRGDQPLAGYQILMENANLTKAQDLGAVTELLSGDFFVPFGRSTSHQLWSSAMVITPTLRGLFGIDIDAQTKTITVNPHLPAGWDSGVRQGHPLPGGSVTLDFSREGDWVVVSA